ncbi:MAG TPA: putative PEP-binding protein, partial [Gemmatimonadaceae bacterium]|nr:putative PEP-binding protein [Gemmatimonadaceae bacterium]
MVGMPASPGIVIGPVHLLLWEVPEVPHRIIPDEAVPGEINRLQDALEQAKQRLLKVRQRAEKHAGEEEAAIFEVQIAILSDQELIGSVEALIRQNIGAEKAFDLVLIEWRQNFARHAQPMIRERVGDLMDVHIRVLSVLLGLPDHDPVDVTKGTNAILVTHDLTPSLTVQLDRDAIAGIATDAGTRTSHVAILARSLGLPAVVGLRDATHRLKAGSHIILDGSSGVIIPNPTQAQIAAYAARAAREAADTAELQGLAMSEPVTIDGVRITLRANVDLPEEAEAAAHSGAEGVGLMRTEFLVVGRATMPDEEEQYRAYKKVVTAFGDKPVVIRTFDVGGDKLPVGGYPTEANPFLGWRAIRMCLDEPELFKTQLRALLRAAMHGD